MSHPVVARVRRWCEANEGLVRACYLTADARLGVVVRAVPNGVRYDPEFEDALTVLDIELAAAGDESAVPVGWHPVDGHPHLKVWPGEPKRLGPEAEPAAAAAELRRMIDCRTALLSGAERAEVWRLLAGEKT